MRKFLRDDRPTLVSMIPVKTKEETVNLIKQSIAGGADAIGLQMNLLDSNYHSEEELAEIISFAQGLPTYITCYRGGSNENLTDEELAEKLLVASKAGGCLIDIMGDMFNRSKDEISLDEESIKKQKGLIEKIHSQNSLVLMSSHTYRFLPEEEVLAIAKAQAERGADIIKIVTMADSEHEMMENFRITAKLKQVTDKPFLFLCGGSTCTEHRRYAPLISGGPFLCTPLYNEFSTPMQPLLTDGVNIVNLIK